MHTPAGGYHFLVVIVLMGPAGAGKTTIGRALAAELGWRFVEGDDYHPAGNVRKMQAGIPLTDADRSPWLTALAHVIANAVGRREHMVVACSALKERYRLTLRDNLRTIRFVYLKASEPLLHERLASRVGHFLDPALVRSQLTTLEEPRDPTTLTLDASLAPEEIHSTIRRQFGV